MMRKIHRQESRAVARKPRDATAVLFGLKFTNNIHYKCKSSQASKARLQSSKHTGAKQNLKQNGHSGSFKVTCFVTRFYPCRVEYIATVYCLSRLQDKTSITE